MKITFVPPMKFFTALFFLFSLLFFSPADNRSGLTENTGRLPLVSGRVIDERNFPIPYAKVIINGLELQTDAIGRFSNFNITFPYDVIVAERYTNTAVLYRGLTISDPDLVLFGEPDDRNFSRAELNVKFSPLPDTADAVVTFISRETMVCPTEKAGAGSENVKLGIQWPSSQSSIRGDVVMLRRYQNGYELYRKKSVLLSRGSRNETIMPSKPELNLDSKAGKVFSNLGEYYRSKYEVALDFTDFSKNSILKIFEGGINRGKNSAELPAKLPSTVRLRVSTYAENRSGSKFLSYYFASPGQDLKLSDEFLPELVVPSDGFLGATSRTEFRYTVGSGAGIYVLEFRSRSPDMKFYVVTSESSSGFPFLSRPEFKNLGSVSFNWRVRKYLTYFSVDEFVRPNIFKNEVGYKGVLYSTGRSFRTGYF